MCLTICQALGLSGVFPLPYIKQMLVYKPNRDVIRTKLKRDMELRGHRPVDLANHCGVTIQAVHGWFKYGRISEKHLKMVARLFRRPLEWYLTDEAAVQEEPGENFSSSGRPPSRESIEIAEKIDAMPAAKRAMLREVVDALIHPKPDGDCNEEKLGGRE